MNKISWILFFVFCSVFLMAQTDSSLQKRTLHVRKDTDTLQVKVTATWMICRTSPHTDLTFTPDKKLREKTEVMSPQNTKLRVVTAPRPEMMGDTFDLRKYLLADPVVQSIRLRPGETDVVTIRVVVNKSGKMRFRDWDIVEALGDTMVVYKGYGGNYYDRNEYKIDMSHRKTAFAFEALSQMKWHPSTISMLKRHPSRHRVKYRRYKGYAVGDITIRYSMN